MYAHFTLLSAQDLFPKVVNGSSEAFLEHISFGSHAQQRIDAFLDVLLFDSYALLKTNLRDTISCILTRQ